MTPTNRSHPNSKGTTFLTLVVVVAVLYFARELFIPLALATLFTFLLAPMVVRLRRWHFGRWPSVLCVVLFAFMIIASIGSLVAVQMMDLGNKLPQYQQNIHRKLDSIRTSGGGIISRASRFFREFNEELNPPAPQNRPGEEKPVPVEVRRTPFSPIGMLRTILGSLISIVLMGAVVTVFVVFMLIGQEDLRDRLIRLAGPQQLNVTTEALDDAGHRVSRYLLSQLIINVVYGVLAGFGLFLIGIPNPVLWGVLAALFRYVPYLGIWIAATMPAAVAFAVNPGWIKAGGVFGLYFGIDLMMYNFAEPIFYGSSTGISPIAILVAAVFWTWLWGPVGLLLATPLTVCVVVVGRYVPTLGFLSILLTDEPGLAPEKRFYQRLLAMDVQEAAEIAETFLKGKELGQLYDSVVIPALVLAEADRHSGKLDETRQQFVLQNIRFIVENIYDRIEELEPEEVSPPPASRGNRPAEKNAAMSPPLLLFPASDEADEIGALMLAQLLQRQKVPVRVVSPAAQASAGLGEAGLSGAPAVCVVAVPPNSYLYARHLSKQLRAEFPGVKVIAAVLSEGDAHELKSRQPPLPADEVTSTLQQTVAEILAQLSGSTSGPAQKSFSS